MHVVGMVLHPERDCSGAVGSILDWAARRRITVLGIDTEVRRLACTAEAVTAAELRRRADLLSGRREHDRMDSGDHAAIITGHILLSVADIGVSALARTAAGPRQEGQRIASFIPYTAQFNMTGQPAVTLPLHWTPAGLPVGVQLVAAYGREDMLIRVASQLEQAAPWSDRHPSVHA